MSNNINPGESIIITWVDGAEEKCIFIESKNGFYVCKDMSGKSVVCRKQNVSIKRLRKE